MKREWDVAQVCKRLKENEAATFADASILWDELVESDRLAALALLEQTGNEHLTDTTLEQSRNLLTLEINSEPAQEISIGIRMTNQHLTQNRIPGAQLRDPIQQHPKYTINIIHSTSPLESVDAAKQSDGLAPVSPEIPA
jgi:hypothetical protein